MQYSVRLTFAGVALFDRWGDKLELVAVPIVAAIIYAVITLVERFPKIRNTGVTVTDENRGRIYGVLKSMNVTEN